MKIAYGGRALLAGLIITTLAASLGPAVAQSDAAAGYPNKPIRLIVGFAAGGGNDLMARLLGQRFSEIIGQPVVIENKAGAGGRIAMDFVKNQPPDGYTIAIGATGQTAIAAAIYPKLTYHPTKDFIPLTMVADFPLILAGPADDKIKTVKDLIEYGKANPDKANYATSSPAFTIAAELFKLKTGIPGVGIPYKSSNEMMLAVAGGNSLYSIADGPPTVPLVQGGKIRALAVMGPKRSSELPDAPSIDEAGFPGVYVGLWNGMFVSAETPSAIVKKLEASLRQAMADPAVREKLKGMAVEPGGGPGEDFRKMIDAEIQKYGEVVKAAKLEFPQ